jgi:diketogulonate reductase-like aldo/keto reductase
MTGATCYDAVRIALDAGYRHLDTATPYRNEAEVGRALRDSGVDRDEVFVTAELPPREARRAEQTLTASLDALGVDAVDLWLVHWPPGGAGRGRTCGSGSSPPARPGGAGRSGSATTPSTRSTGSPARRA